MRTLIINIFRIIYVYLMINKFIPTKESFSLSIQKYEATVVMKDKFLCDHIL